MLNQELLTIIGFIYALIEICGISAAVHAVMTVRTSQGAIAWAVGLVSFPLLALPLYVIFGRTKFEGYVSARRAGNLEINHIAQELSRQLPKCRAVFKERTDDIRVLEAMADMPFTRYNSAELLIDGKATFEAIFQRIAAAREYILVQFYIVRDDRLGRALQAALVAKARSGVRVFFLYDEIGCKKLPASYLKVLKEAGIQATHFNTTQGLRNRFRLNFRNHRKIVVVDGQTAFVGGFNVGDEYMGRNPKFGAWRDTHVQVEGPCVPCVQLSFLEDWYWATRKVPELNWSLRPAMSGDQRILVLPSGPADQIETCGLFFTHAINSARKRIWISSPYFVPDRPIIAALQLAALRGVDVRILLPQKPDQLLVYWSAFSFVAETEPLGVKFYRYRPGFLHNKVMIVDDMAATVGTANFDNRSFRIDFEITMAFIDREFATRVGDMMARDLEQCRPVRADDLYRRPLWFKLAVRIARLMAPIQ